MKNVTTGLHRHIAVWWWLALCAPGALGIKVKFGTSDGPIVPPAPEPPRVVPAPPYRAPAPVWEDRSADLPDPNANWRPLFVPSVRYTQVNYRPAPPPLPAPTAAPAQSSAQRFVSAYLPRHPPPSSAPAPAPSGTYLQPSGAEVQPLQPLQLLQPLYQHQTTQQGQQLSSQSVAGVGIRYFVPSYHHQRVQDAAASASADPDDAHANRIDGAVSDAIASGSADDAQLSYGKEYRRRARASQESTQNVVYYQWPVYVAYRQQ